MGYSSIIAYMRARGKFGAVRLLEDVLGFHPPGRQRSDATASIEISGRLGVSVKLKKAADFVWSHARYGEIGNAI